MKQVAIGKTKLGVNVNLEGNSTPIGTVVLFLGEEIPKQWLLCDGGVYHKTEYPKLYALIGTAYNTGNEPEDYFAVPNWNKNGQRYIVMASVYGSFKEDQIDDKNITEVNVWSASKTNKEVGRLDKKVDDLKYIDDDVVNKNLTWSSDLIEKKLDVLKAEVDEQIEKNVGSGMYIADQTVSDRTTWSSAKTASKIENQNIEIGNLLERIVQLEKQIEELKN